jgi:hypothetical protein
METQSTAIPIAARHSFPDLVERLFAENPVANYDGTSLECAVRFHLANLGAHEWRRDAFRTLLLRLYAKKCYAVLRNPAFMEIVANIAAFGNRMVRPAEEWKKDSLTAEGQLASLIRHCFAKYEVPEFMEYAFAGSNRIHMHCYVKLGRGDSVHSLVIVPAGFTAKMAHAFRNTPRQFTIVQAIRRAQALGSSATPARAEAIAWAHELEHFQNPAFSLAVIQFAARVEAHIAFDALQSALVYLNAMYAADNGYSLRGRTWTSVAKRAAEYHAELAKKRAAEQFSDWELCGVKDYEVEKESGIFRIMQLGTSQALYDEGAEQSHCVADYAYDCTIGSVAIFSLRKYIPGEECCAILATIEVAIETMAIVQAKAKFNEEPSEEAFAIMMGWANAEGLANRICYEEYDEPVQPAGPLQYQGGHPVPEYANAAPPPRYEEPVYYNRQPDKYSGDDGAWKYYVVFIIKLLIVVAKCSSSS